MLHRRAFLQSLAALTATLALPSLASAQATQPADKLGPLLPLRKLGKTGAAVTMLGLGGFHLDRLSEAAAQQTVELAIEGGVRFFDTAENYGDSEIKLGKLLVPRYRDHVFLMSKSYSHNAATARKHLDQSLRRLGTDRLDLWQMHSVDSPDDAEGRITNGVLDAMLDAQQQGKVRFIGFTGHSRPEAHQRMLELMAEKGDALQTCQMPINVLDPSDRSFVEGVLPTLAERGYGVLAMKTLAGGTIAGFTPQGRPRRGARVVPDRVTLAEALHFVWSLPISVLISGPDSPAQFREVIGLARSFTQLDEARRKQLIDKVADLAGRDFEWYKT